MGEFGDINEKTADGLKLKFLNAIISENENLREEFLLFVRSENNGAPGLTFENFLKSLNLSAQITVNLLRPSIWKIPTGIIISLPLPVTSKIGKNTSTPASRSLMPFSAGS